MKTGALTFAALVLGASACADLQTEVAEDTRGSDGSSGGGTTADPTTMNTVDPDPTAQTSAQSDSADATGGETTDGPPATDGPSATDSTSVGETEAEGTTAEETDCIQVTIEDVGPGPGLNWWVTTSITPNIANPGQDDLFRMEFYSDQSGFFDLSMSPNDNYASCFQCLRLIADFQNSSTQFFQRSGTLEVDPASNPESGTLIASLTDVVLMEVTLFGANSTPVEGGDCIAIDDYFAEP